MDTAALYLTFGQPKTEWRNIGHFVQFQKLCLLSVLSKFEDETKKITFSIFL
jgi:hypothetical protein